MIHLLVGNTGSGKTTYAKKLKAETNAVVFSIDKWNKTLFLPDKQPTDGLDWFLERIDRAEAMMMDLVIQLETAHTDSILDLGLSKQSHRQKFREFAQQHNYKVKLHYLDVPKEVRWQRVVQRNTEKGDSFEFEVSREDFDFMETWFEKPTEEELQGGIIVTE